jgi:signal transduction histidine kinase
MDIERGHHRIDYVHPPEPVHIRGDPYRLEQVIANLVENALKYSAGDSTVRVTLDVNDDFALLSVADEGIGIPRDQQEQLFERYFRARNVSVTSYGGLGLGLYISRDIVERHGGRIWVESEVGRGSTFYVALPLLNAASPTPPEPPHHTGPPQQVH